MKHPHVITCLKDEGALTLVPRLSLPGLDRAYHDEREHGNRAAVMQAIEGRLVAEFGRCPECVVNDGVLRGRCLHCAAKEGGR